MSANRDYPRRRRRLRAGVAALACATVLQGAVPALAVSPDDVEVRADPGVIDAEGELQGAQADLDQIRAHLDEAAAAYEHAHAHHLRLVEEADASTGAVRSAHERTASARASWGQRIAEAYKRPEVDLSLGEAILASPDAATAVHRAALVTQVTARGGHEVAAAQRVATAVTGQARQQHVVGAGTATAAAEREERAKHLERLVASAGDAVRAAEQRLGDAEKAAADRVREEREAAAEAAQRARRDAEEAAEQARQQAAREAAERAQHSGSAGGASGGPGVLPAGSGGPAPAPVAGKVCPVGRPHGFIDSWGFPRSGGRRHQGVDIFAARGTPLYAVADGVISRVGSNSLGGLVIDMIDTNGDRYYYAHLHTQLARQGQRVRAGDVIGTVGNTGNARTTPPHLHWQYHPGNGAAVNPYPLAARLCKGT